MLTGKEIEQVRQGLQKNASERIAFLFQALGDTTRLKIVRLLATHKDLCVTDIAKICGMSVPAVSYQMKMLEMVGLVKRDRMGKMICYELRREDALIKQMIKLLAKS
jgi:DNA-binding transcriptional ArsR family regulator